MKIKPRIEKRSDLYYGQFHHVISLRLQLVWMTRGLDHAALDHRSEQRLFWRKEQIASAKLQELHNWISLLSSQTDPFQYTICNNCCYIYTNSEQLIDHIASVPYVSYVRTRTCQVTLPKDIIVLRQSPYKMRTYMKEITIRTDQFQSLREYVMRQEWRVGPGFQRFLTSELGYHRCQRNYFVDHNDDRDTLFLNMIVPGIVRRTLPIQSGAAK